MTVSIGVIMVVSCIALTFVVTLVALYRYLRFRSQVDQIAGPPVKSVLYGNLDLFLRSPNQTGRQYIVGIYQLLLRFCAQYSSNGAFRLWFGPLHPLFVLTNADSIERLLTSSINLNKAYEYKFMAPWLGDGLLLAESSIWRPRRKLLTPAFHFKILENFIPIFARHTSILLRQIDDLQLDINDRSTLVCNDVRPLFEDLTLNIIKETSMGIIDNDPVDSTKTMNQEVGNFISNNERYRLAMKHAFRGAAYRSKNPFYWFDWIFRCTKVGRTFYHHVETMLNYTDQIIHKRMQDFRENKQLLTKKGQTTIFLDILLQKYFNDSQQTKSSLVISPDSMRSEVNTFILGGHDTTAMALTFSTLLIGHNYEVQQKIHKELDSIFANNPQKSIELDDLRQMRYLEQCIKETLRLYPSIQMIGRWLSKPITLPNGQNIPANTTCYVPILALHRNPKYYPNPDYFDPDRFLQTTQEANGITSPYAYIPFSAGPRNCIGQKYAMLELKYVLASLFRQYRVCSITTPDEVLKEITPVIKPLTKIKIHFQRRKTS